MQGVTIAKSASISMRVNPQIKAEAESIYGSLGMTLSEAINIFLHKSILEGGLPFDVRQPRYNSEVEAAIHEARGALRLGIGNVRRIRRVSEHGARAHSHLIKQRNSLRPI